MAKKTIKLTENDLRNIIYESINSVLNEGIDSESEMDLSEEGLEEGLWNQVKSGAGTLFGKGNGSLSSRISKAQKNWNTQGQLDDINKLKDSLINFIESGQLNPQMTIAQLIGGKYNGGKFGRITGMAANRKSQISNRGGHSY